ncbi:MAG: alpha-amylase family glycosyl hydrolase [Bacteroidota bacterium]
MKLFINAVIWAVALFGFTQFADAQFQTVGIIGSATPAGWNASTPMIQDPNDSNSWTLMDVSLISGEAKFRADDDWAVNWGASDFPQGTAIRDGANIPVSTGTYDIFFNDETGAYRFESTSAPIPFGTVGIIGSATPSGWDASTAMVRSASDDHQWTLTVLLNIGELKFRADNDWAVNWGGTAFPTGDATQDGPNIAISVASYYEIQFNSISGEYTFTQLTPDTYETVGIIGSATPSGWSASSPMEQDPNDPHVWSLSNLILIDGEAKFRANDDWAVNWGAVDFPEGTGTLNGPNIPIVGGTYDVSFNDVTGSYSFAPITVGDGPLVRLDPPFPTADEPVTLFYDATKGSAGLVGSDKVYIHTGVVLSGPEGRVWSNVVGNYGQDDGVGEMTRVPGESDLWQFTYDPSIRDYYSVEEQTTIFRLSMIFRNADGTAEGKTESEGDIYVDIDPGNYVRFTEPIANEVFVLAGDSLTVTAEASETASSLQLMVNGNLVSEVSDSDQVSYTFSPNTSETIALRVAGSVNGEAVVSEKTIEVLVRQPNAIAELPGGAKEGINYSGDPTQVLLVLTAPQKDFVYAVGDFSDWEIQPQYQMNQTPDGEQFWIIIDGLTSQKEYVFQYWVDGVIKIGDPFADKVVDPFNDASIPEAVYPELIDYRRTENGLATVFQTNQTPYVFAHPEPVGGRPQNEDLVIYELLVRDFIGSHSYDDLIDTLDYIQRLGANAIELMPIMEFEGNESWGYNPSYLFAPDKYYGTKDDLKRFIDAVHARGMVVIADIVLNHQFGQSPMVQLYFDAPNGRPAANSPWFNVEATHPFNVGFDMNHESTYVKNYIDQVNRYWIEEYQFDGYRFDLSKGFTQNTGNDPADEAAWNRYDQSRVDIITRMVDEIWAYDPKTYVILEHLGVNEEETVLANYGMMLWGNLNHNYRDLVAGNTGVNLEGVLSSSKGWNDKHLISYMESHDEERLVYGAITSGLSNSSYNIQDTVVALERSKLAAAFYYTVPGPKMLWQFGELGYDFSIDFNSRIGNKPIPWGDQDGLNYHVDPDRQKLYKATAAMINLVNEHKEVFEGGSFNWTSTGQLREIVIDHQEMDVVVIGNFGLSNGTMSPSFTHTGTWYDFFTGSEVNIETDESIELSPGEFHIYTDQPVNFPEPGLVRVFKPIVSVTPGTFGKNDRIQLIFDATAADPAGTNGLIGAESVYLYAGIITEGPEGTTWENSVGSTDQDDGVGRMTKDPNQDNRWTISFRPNEYFTVGEEQEVYRLAMYFRDADGSNVGKGIGGQPIYVEVAQPQQVVTVTPDDFDADTEIRLTFDATKADGAGTSGLVGSPKVYLHSGVVLTDTDSPTGADWSNIVGNYGEDDGIGEMTRVPDSTDLWEITLTPRNYYSLAPEDTVYYLSMVFRNADGTAEGKGPGGSDIYIRPVKAPVSVTGPDGLVADLQERVVSIRWNDNATNELGYILERVVNGTGDFEVLAYLPANSTSFQDADVSDGNEYTYRVLATNAAGPDSDYSAVGNVVIVLAKPTDLVAQPVAKRQIDLFWKDNSESETGYVISRTTRWGKKRGLWRVVATLPADSESYSDHLCYPGIHYFYRVVAIKDSLKSGYSNIASANTRFIRPGDSKLVKFYPNPADTEVTFELEEDFKGLAIVTIRNAYGWPVKWLWFRRGRSKTIKIDTSGYQEGVYLVDVFVNGKRYVERLFVEHL